LGDPVFVRPLGGRVEDECLLLWDPGGSCLNNQSRVNTRKLLSEGKAPKLSLRLHLVQKSGLLWATEPKHSTSE